MGRIFASTDWHGNWAASKQLLDFLAKDDKLFYLGDCTDRGKYGIKLLKTLMDDPRIIYIKGNHDEFLECAIEKELWDTDFKYIPHMNRTKLYDFDINGWTAIQGGNSTFEELYKETKEVWKEILKYIQEMPFSKIITTEQGNIILEHAGYTPGVVSKWHDPLWDRSHIYQKWGTSANVYMIHGHTPVQYLKFDSIGYYGREPLTKEDKKYKKEFLYDEPTDYKPTILRYCEGRKFDLDMCTICSNRVALLDLNTFEEYYFDGKDEE